MSAVLTPNAQCAGNLQRSATFSQKVPRNTAIGKGNAAVDRLTACEEVRRLSFDACYDRSDRCDAVATDCRKIIGQRGAAALSQRNGDRDTIHAP
jgi:hypothetical protein